MGKLQSGSCVGGVGVKDGGGSVILTILIPAVSVISLTTVFVNDGRGVKGYRETRGVSIIKSCPTRPSKSIQEAKKSNLAFQLQPALDPIPVGKIKVLYIFFQNSNASSNDCMLL
ncbi:hypothetical protein L1887_28846 [Cichorium endivia]|nr:hypothetical protein L1887_28846 [Cichorium endivia]